MNQAPTRKVVIDSIANDVHAHAIAWALMRKSAVPMMIFAENFPSRSSVSIHLGANGSAAIHYEGPEGAHTLSSEDEIVYWPRRCATPILAPSVRVADVAAAQCESVEQLRCMREVLSMLPGCITLNSIVTLNASECKALQLVIARRCGLRVPRSLFSNDPVAIREFSRECSSGIIYKTNTPLMWHRPGQRGGTTYATYCRLMTADRMPNDDVLKLSSGIYQEHVKKLYEVRAVVMGQTCLATRIDSQVSAETVMDWRPGQGTMPMERIDVPKSLLASCTKYLSEMNLLYGCFDFIVTPDLEWIFLECNDHGQWLWQETRCSDLPLLDAFASFLCSPSRNFSYVENECPVRFRDYMQRQYVDDCKLARERHVLSLIPHQVTVEQS